MPVLAVKHSVEHLAELAAKYPGARQLLSDYLVKSLPIEVLGYHERAASSAVQYAERLLAARIGLTSPAERNAEIARRLVYEYKDHGFAIDAREAATIFGPEVVTSNSKEYKAANNLYEILDVLEWIMERTYSRGLSFIGRANNGCRVRTKRQA